MHGTNAMALQHTVWYRSWVKAESKLSQSWVKAPVCCLYAVLCWCCACLFLRINQRR